MDDGSEAAKSLLTAVQLKLVDPFIIPHFHECILYHSLVQTGMEWFVLWVLFAFFLFPLGVQRSDRGTFHRTTGSECFLLGYMECQKKSTNPSLKSTHTKTTHGRIQKASAELYFSRRRVRRGLIFRATLPPTQLERNAPFHRLNWGHAWHGNNRGRSHNFPDSGGGGA